MWGGRQKIQESQMAETMWAVVVEDDKPLKLGEAGLFIRDDMVLYLKLLPRLGKTVFTWE